ncbi:MAG: hypothetical protein ACOYNB_00120 [Aquabacterium sp.]|uniref:hypothetical protein n=1 Tax=Aquabacterium sp. TaxID=1872578 RepID=UPI003BBF667A
MEGAIAKSAERADQVARRTSLYSLYTVVLTALLTATLSLFAQSFLMRHQRKIHRADTEAKVANSYIEWQLKQLSELYGPVRALLGQSNAIYRQMNKALVAADGTRFQLIAGQDFDDKEFQIRIAEHWTRFRTVQHLTEVYGKSYGVEPYFDDVVDVGARLAELIRERAGLARQEDEELIDVMGEYLAHYLVLKRLHERVKKGDAIHLNAVEEQAVFPVRLQQLVDNGFQSINKQVLQWRGLSNTQKKERCRSITKMLSPTLLRPHKRI